MAISLALLGFGFRSLSALFCGQKNILTFLRRASSKIEVNILLFVKNI